MPKEFHAKVDDDVEVFIKPDKSQMIPFKPRRLPAPGAHPVQGGEFPMPNGTPYFQFFTLFSIYRIGSFFFQMFALFLKFDLIFDLTFFVFFILSHFYKFSLN